MRPTSWPGWRPVPLEQHRQRLADAGGVEGARPAARAAACRSLQPLGLRPAPAPACRRPDAGVPGRALYLNEKAWAKPISSTRSQRGREVRVALAREADDEVGRQREVGPRRAQGRRRRGDSRRRCSLRFIASSTASEPDCTGRCRNGISCGTSPCARDQVGVHVARDARSCSAAAQARGSRPARRISRREAPAPAVRAVAVVGVDVLAEQRDLARAGADQAAAPRARMAATGRLCSAPRV